MDFSEGSIGVLPAAAAAAHNPFKQCSSVSDIFDLECRDDWKSYPMKVARTDNSYHCKMLLPNGVDNNPGARGLPYYHQHQGYDCKPAGFPLAMGRETANSSSGLEAVLAGTRPPFTPSQWQELEHQALIFKYMMAGVAVPPDLLIPIRKTVNMNLLTTLSAGSLRPNLGWSSFHLGFGNNADPEPGRCRRTDGKKWRCSRDAVPHQKYCERHMNRGRHRSRKPVEGQTASATSQSSGGAKASSSSGTSSVSLAAARSTNLLGTSISTNSQSYPQQHQRNQIGSSLGVNAFPSSHSEGFPAGPSGAPATQFRLPINISLGDSAMANKEYRYLNGGKADLEEQQIFISESSVTLKDTIHAQDSQMFSSDNNAWRSMTASKISLIPDQPSKTNSTMRYDSRSLPGQDFGLMSEPSQMSLLSMTVAQDQRSSHFSSSSSSTPGLEAMDSVRVGCEPQGQPLLHFFDDWPRSRDQSKLSISNPMTLSSDFSANSPPHSGKLSLSPLKLSTLSRDVDPTQMELGVGMGIGHTNWIPITWESPVGGPLAEVLHSSTPRDCKTLGLDLMTNGWDSSPRESSQMTSPTGVLQKTFGSHSDSSTGSSPHAKTVSGLCENLQSSVYTNMPS